MGLKNAGATCYMNAVFQQLFMQPSIRALVLGAREEASQERHNSTFYQFQVHAQHPLPEGTPISVRHDISNRARAGQTQKEPGRISPEQIVDRC